MHFVRSWVNLWVALSKSFWQKQVTFFRQMPAESAKKEIKVTQVFD